MYEQQPYGQQQPMPQAVPAPPGAFAPQKPYLGLIIIGIIILLVGGLIYISAGFLDDPEDYTEMEDYSDGVRTITTLGNLLGYIGLILLSIGLIIGAIKDEDLPANVRLGMFIAMGLIVGLKIMSLYPT